MRPGPPTVLSALRDRVRRLEIIAGIGFLAAALGGVVSAPLVLLLVPWARNHPFSWTLILAQALVSRLWVYLLLPLFWLGISRIVRDLRPWTTAIGSALVGEMLYLGLDAISGTLGGVLARPGLWLPRLLTLALGIVLSARAVAASRRRGENVAGA